MLCTPLLLVALQGTALEKSVDAVFSEFTKPDRPGAAVAVIENGEIKLAKGYGRAQLEYGVPIGADTVFHVASVTKQFTAFAIALLEADGKLSLDDDVRKHLPDLPDFGHTLTLRHLANHTSGIRDQWELLAMSGWRLDDVITTDQILRVVCHQRELNFAPGTRYLYSNTGFTLLAEVVKKVSGMPFRSFLKKRVFDPLGMRHTHVHDDHERIVPNRAYSYKPAGNAWRRAVLSYANAGATSLFTTASDLARWLDNFATTEVGGEAVRKRMLERGKLANGSAISYALGIVHGKHRGLATIGHGGSDAGFRCQIMWFPERRLGVVVLSNAANFIANRFARRVADVCLGKPQAPTKPKAKPTRPGVKVDRRVLERYAGEFLVTGGIALTFRVADGALLASATGLPEQRLVARSPTEFEVPSLNSRISFQPEKDGTTNRATVHLPSGRRKAVRRGTREPTRFPVADLTGTYYSDELDTIYRIVKRGDGIVAQHRRHGTIPLLMAGEDRARGGRWFFARVAFERDAQKRVTGFRLTGSRVRNLQFRKIRLDR